MKKSFSAGVLVHPFLPPPGLRSRLGSLAYRSSLDFINCFSKSGRSEVNSCAPSPVKACINRSFLRIFSSWSMVHRALLWIYPYDTVRKEILKGNRFFSLQPQRYVAPRRQDIPCAVHRYSRVRTCFLARPEA